MTHETEGELRSAGGRASVPNAPDIDTSSLALTRQARKFVSFLAAGSQSRVRKQPETIASDEAKSKCIDATSA